ncbi:MAG: helical backbone metal receptor [Myxococcota bacterium]
MILDDLGRDVPLDGLPQRIVSLCPSQTELLFDLGLGERVVGTTKFCVHPAERVKKTVRVGGTKAIDLERVHALRPDLVLAQKEENTKEMVQALAAHYPVFVTDVLDVEGGLRMIERVGELVGAGDSARQMVESIRDGVHKRSRPLNKRVLYLIWRDPWMGAGRETFIDSVLRLCGLKNALEEARYPVLDESSFSTLRADAVFLSSEPFPFREKHRAELETLMPGTPSFYVDGELFSWYGSRMRFLPELIGTVRGFFGEDSPPP